jgi:hypothetical protein
MSKVFMLRNRLRHQHENYNWHVQYSGRGTVLDKIFAQLHYLGSHSPDPVAARWKEVERRFLDRYSPNLWTMIRLGIKKERF